MFLILSLLILVFLLCFVFVIVDSIIFFMMLVVFFGENVRMFSVLLIGKLWIWLVIRCVFCVEMWVL